MPRQRLNLGESKICDHCNVGKTYNNETCQSCNKTLCEPCFQFVGCCEQERSVDAGTGGLRIPSIKNMRTGVLREHPSRRKHPR